MGLFDSDDGDSLVAAMADHRSENPSDGREGLAHEMEIDQELEAAIEYKIAATGVAGAEFVLDLLNRALRRAVAT
ncbi:MAG: hypothetical protein AAGF45_07155 [Pseudomonadota bacterium]